MNLRPLDGKVAVVTGAGAGIGRATAIRFAAEGARVVVNDIDDTSASATVDTIVSAGGAAVARGGDVRHAVDVERLVDTAIDRYGRLDVMHNNAGYGRACPVAELTDADLDEMLQLHVHATLHGTRAALRVMAAQRSGSIINTASNAGIAPATDRASYSAAKAAVISLTKSTALESARSGVRANAICPGPIATAAVARWLPDPEYYAAQLPMGRLGTPEEVASVALFLASDESTYVSGVAISVDGALTARLSAPFLRPEDVTGGARS